MLVRMNPNVSGVYVDPKESNNLEVFTEREVFLQAATNVIGRFADSLFERTQPLMQEWIAHHEQERVEIYRYRLLRNV
jgi:hypothetical protein